MNLGEVPCDLLLFLPPASSGPPGYWPWHWLLGAQDNEQGGSLKWLPATPARLLLGRNKPVRAGREGSLAAQWVESVQPRDRSSN